MPEGVEPRAEAVGEGQIVGAYDVDPQLLQQRERVAGSGVGEEGRALVEPAGGVGEFLDGAVAAVPGGLARDPPGEDRVEAAEVLRGDQEGDPARAEQPLEADGGDVVVGARVEVEPAGGLRRVDIRTRPVFLCRRPQRGQVGDAAVGGLGGADRDERGAGAYRLGDPLQRDGAHLEIGAHVEGVHHGAEVGLGGEDFGTGGQ